MDFASLQQSPFLQALGSAIFNNIWQGFIIWLIFETIIVSYKNASAKFKNNLSVVLVFFSFLLFCASFIFKLIENEKLIYTVQSFTNSKMFPVIQTNSFFEKLKNYVISTLPYLSVAYIFLLFLLTIKFIAAYRYVYIISNKQLIQSPSGLQFFASNVAQQMGITKKISVWISQLIDVPATIGFIKPVLLISIASINNLSSHQLEAIILHELSHIKRNDYLINLFISIIETILFFNPFVSLLSKVIKREREHCCDDFVLQYQYDPYSYASALLRLEESRTNKVKLAMSAVSGKNQLLLRIKRITNKQVVSKQFNYGQKLLALILTTGVICSAAWLSPVQKTPVPITTLDNKALSAADLKQRFSEKLIKDLKYKDVTKTLKHPFLKTNVSALQQLMNGKPNQNFFELNKESNSFNSPEEKIKHLSKTNNIGNPEQFLLKNIKVPESVNIKNFTLQKEDFNVDLSNISFEQLNQTLKKAYKGISSINWKKLQNQINQSITELKTIDLPAKVKSELHIQKNNDFPGFKKLQKLYNNIDPITKNIETKVLSEISLAKTELAFAQVKQNQLQQHFKQLQKQYGGNFKNFSFKYTEEENSNPDDQSDEQTNSGIKKYTGKKNIKF